MDNQDKNNPLVTVALMTYNRAGYLPGAIESMLAQTYRNFELIISNDASTDGTDEICKEYAKKDKRIRYIKQEKNLGLVPCHKFILNQGRGKYFIWVDDDDIRDKRFLEDCVDAYRKHPELIMVFTDFVDIDKNGKEIGRYDPAKYMPLAKDTYERLKEYTLFYLENGRNHIFGGLWKREAILDDPLFGLQARDDRSPGVAYYWGFDNFFVFRNLAKGPFGFVPHIRFFRRSRVPEDTRPPRPFIPRLFMTAYHRFDKIFGTPYFWYVIRFTMNTPQLTFSQKLKLVLWTFFVMARIFFVRKI